MQHFLGVRQSGTGELCAAQHASNLCDALLAQYRSHRAQRHLATHLFGHDQVVIRRVSGLNLPIPIELIWRRDNTSPSLARFTTIARRTQARMRLA